MTIRADKTISTDRDINLNAVTPGFFQTMGIKIIQGRSFDERDFRSPGDSGSWRSAIVGAADQPVRVEAGFEAGTFELSVSNITG